MQIVITTRLGVMAVTLATGIRKHWHSGDSKSRRVRNRLTITEGEHVGLTEFFFQ
jgi:hypothetical protein